MPAPLKPIFISESPGNRLKYNRTFLSTRRSVYLLTQIEFCTLGFMLLVKCKCEKWKVLAKQTEKVKRQAAGWQHQTTAFAVKLPTWASNNMTVVKTKRCYMLCSIEDNGRKFMTPKHAEWRPEKVLQLYWRNTRSLVLGDLNISIAWYELILFRYAYPFKWI